MNANIKRIIAELQADAKVQEMHRKNIEKRKAVKERRRAAMLARMAKPVAIYNQAQADVEGKRAMMRKAFEAVGDIRKAYEMCEKKGDVAFIMLAQDVYFEMLDEEMEREEEARRADILALWAKAKEFKAKMGK
ncbi:hypothetical protein [Escherichia coli]|uniref:hypothetical protein n=1 Tax=Escherichia coli TaxID=562 RepID=UPI00287AB71B|nr:hypothetical protein [Escherichia coli]MDS1650669.1 hypothetical protein [Escherichia coli]